MIVVEGTLARIWSSGVPWRIPVALPYGARAIGSDGRSVGVAELVEGASDTCDGGGPIVAVSYRVWLVPKLGRCRRWWG